MSAVTVKLKPNTAPIEEIEAVSQGAANGSFLIRSADGLGGEYQPRPGYAYLSIAPRGCRGGLSECGHNGAASRNGGIVHGITLSARELRNLADEMIVFADQIEGNR